MATRSNNVAFGSIMHPDLLRSLRSREQLWNVKMQGRGLKLGLEEMQEGEMLSYVSFYFLGGSCSGWLTRRCRGG